MVADGRTQPQVSPPDPAWRPLARLLPAGVAQPTREVHPRLESIVAQLERPHGALDPRTTLFIEPGSARHRVIVWYGQGEAPALPGQAPDQTFQAPEVARGGVATARSDVYSLGPIARMLWTGRLARVDGPPRARKPEPPASLFRRSAWQPPDSDGAPHPALPIGFEEWCSRCTAERPEDRFGSARDAMGALLALERADPPGFIRESTWAARLRAAGAVGPLAPGVDTERLEVVIGPTRWRLSRYDMGGPEAPLLDEVVAVARLLLGQPTRRHDDATLRAVIEEVLGVSHDPGLVALEGDDLVVRHVTWGWPHVIDQGCCVLVFGWIAREALPADREVLASLVGLLGRMSYHDGKSGPLPPCRFCGEALKEPVACGDHCEPCALHWCGSVF